MSKFCAKCNFMADDNDQFCQKCGSTDFVTSQQNESEEPQQANASVSNENVSENEQTYFNNENFEDVKPKKKGFFKKVGKKLLFIGLPIVLVVAIIWSNFVPIWGFVLKTVGTGEQYFRFTANNTVKNSINDITDTYDEMFFNRKDQAVDMQVSFTVNEKVTDLIEQYTGEEFDLDWINTTKINYYVNQNDDRAEVKYGVILDDKDFANAYLMSDQETGEIYVKLDGLTDKVLGIKLEDIVDLSDVPENFETVQKVYNQILPKPELLNKLLTRYTKVAINSIDNVNKSSETVTIEDVKQKFTVLTIEGSEQQAMNIVVPVLEGLKEDKDLKEYIENLQKVLVDNDIVDEDDIDEDLYTAFLEGINDALDEAKDYDADTDALFEVKLYLNGLSEFSGIEVIVDDESMFRWIDVKSGKNIATEISSPALSQAILNSDKFVGIRGKGTEKGNKINAEYNIIFDDTPLVTLKVEDYNKKKAENGYLNGKFTITPSSDLFDKIGVGAVANLTSPYIEFTFENSKKVSNTKIAVGGAGTELVAINIDAKISSAKKIKDMTADYDIDEAEEWLEDIDLDELQEKFFDTELGGFLEDMVFDTKESVEIVERVEYVDGSIY